MAEAPAASAPAAPETIDPVTDMLGGGRIVAFRVDLALAVGSIGAGLLLSQFWFWTNSATTEKRDGWFWMTCKEISEQTGLSKEEQITARARLRKLGVLDEDKRGVPMKLWFHIRKPQLIELLRTYAEANSYLSGIPIDEQSGIPTDGKGDSYLSGLPKNKVGQFRQIARGKADGKVAGFPFDITESPSETSSPISLNISSDAPAGESPSHKCDPPGGIGTGNDSDEEPEPDDPPAFYWGRALRLLKSRVAKPTFETHLRALTPVSIEEEGVVGTDTGGGGGGGLTFVLSAPSDFTRRWVRDRFLDVIRVALEEEIGQAVNVKIVEGV